MKTPGFAIMSADDSRNYSYYPQNIAPISQYFSDVPSIIQNGMLFNHLQAKKAEPVVRVRPEA